MGRCGFGMLGFAWGESDHRPLMPFFLATAGGGLETRVLHWMGLMKGCYVHTRDLLQLDSHRPIVPVDWCTRGPSPLRLDRLQRFLCYYPDTQVSSYWAHGLSTGFLCGFQPGFYAPGSVS